MSRPVLYKAAVAWITSPSTTEEKHTILVSAAHGNTLAARGVSVGSKEQISPLRERLFIQDCPATDHRLRIQEQCLKGIQHTTLPRTQ